MQSLPLWKLPFLARKNVFRQMNPNDVFNLSMTSMKSKLIIKAFHKLPPASLVWNLGLYKSNLNGTSAYWRDEERVFLSICFVEPCEDIGVYVRDLEEGEPPENYSLSTVNRTPILMSRKNFYGFFSVCEKEKKRTFDEKMEVMEMISRHFLDIVNVESFELSYRYHDDLPMNKFIKCFVFDITKKFRDVTIFSHHQELKAREFKFLMNEIETDVMKLNTIGRVKGVFTHPKIEFGRHSAVSFDSILNIQSQNFESRMDELLEPSECVQLLVAWSNGEKLQNLKKLIIHHGYEEYNNLIEEIIKRTREFEGEVPFEIMDNYFNDDEDVLRIKRRSDERKLRLRISDGSFEIDDETAWEEPLN